MRIDLWILTSFITTVINGANILIYSPSYSRSHLMTNGRIADILSEAGHKVVLFIPEFEPTDYNETKIAEIIHMRRISGQYLEYMSDFGGNLFEMTTCSIQELKGWAETCAGMCEAILHREGELNRLREYKFDIGFAEQLDLCGAGVIRALGIPNHIWLSSGPIYESMAYLLGIPNPLSYIPTVEDADFSVHMSFMERAYNLYLWLRAIYIHHLETDLSTGHFRRLVDPNFPNLRTIAAESSLAFVNSDEFVDAARPILHKTVYIGGIGIPTQPVPLNQKFSEMMKKGRKGVVLMSFGTVVPPSSFPREVTVSLFKVFSKLSDYHFIMKADKNDKTMRALAKDVPNLDLVKWIPQVDLLGHPRLKLFIMHGGQRGIMEASFRGTPMLVVPFFADQFRNGFNVRDHGTGLCLHKNEMTHDKLKEKLEELLGNDKYAKAARRLSTMIQSKPNKPEEQLLKWTEFVATFGSIPELQVAGADFNFVKYLCLDVILVALSAIIVILSGLIYIARRMLNKTIVKKTPVHKKRN